MTTRAELAFKALDKDNSGYITNREMKNLSSKLSSAELDALMKKVSQWNYQLCLHSQFSIQLDSDGDGKLTFEEFKKMFDKIDLKTRQRKAKKEQPSSKHP